MHAGMDDTRVAAMSVRGRCSQQEQRGDCEPDRLLHGSLPCCGAAPCYKKKRALLRALFNTTRVRKLHIHSAHAAHTTHTAVVMAATAALLLFHQLRHHR